jgi:hypothetical protein
VEEGGVDGWQQNVAFLNNVYIICGVAQLVLLKLPRDA